MNEIVVCQSLHRGFPVLAITQFWQLPNFGNYPILAIWLDPRSSAQIRGKWFSDYGDYGDSGD
jgi:hypothetical protein